MDDLDKPTLRDRLRDLWHGEWTFGWDDRRPLPSWGGAVYIWYDGPHYALRIWRVYVAID
jgi:hypothetical protein